MRGRLGASARSCLPFIAAVVLGLTVGVGPAAADIPVQRTDLGTLGGAFSQALGANAAGEVVGNSQIGPNAQILHAFAWTAAGGMTDLGALPGGSRSAALAVNDNGQVVGWSDIGDNGIVHAFSWTPGGGMVDLGSFGGHEAEPVGVTDDGRVFGYSDDADGYEHAFVWTQSGGMVDLGTLGGSEAYPTAVSGDGEVVGYSAVAGDSAYPPFTWTAAGGMTQLPTLGGNFAQAYAVNGPGAVAGDSDLVGESVRHAFYWTAADGITDLGTLGGNESHTLGMNSSGQVVGYSDLNGGPANGDDPFSWTATGGMVDLGSLGGTNGRAVAVNDGGQVVGWSAPSAGGAAHGFSWTPGDGMVDLDLPGSNGLPRAVTNTGLIIGASADFGTAQSHATIWQVDDGSSTVPFPPQNLGAGAGDGEATLSWTAPSGDGGSAVTGYTVRVSPGGAIYPVDPGSTQATITGLDNGTTYTFSVTAANAVGDSSPSAVSNSVTPAAGSPPPVVVSTTADPGDTVTTDPTNTGPTADVPVTTSVTTPNGGQVTIVEGAPPGTSPSGFVIGGQEIDIVAPAGTSSSPLQLSFGLYPQPGQDPTSTTIFRAEGGGDPAPVPPCDPSSPGEAVPDPCIASIGWDPTTTFIQVSVLTSSASLWSEATPEPAAIKVIPRGFAPKAVKVVPGATVTWRFKAGSAVHSVSDQLGLGPSGQPLFDSGPVPAGSYTAGPFVAAGGYPFGSDPKDVIRVPLETIPASGAPGSSVTLVWATSAPGGYAFDVRMRFKAKATTKWQRWTAIASAATFTHTRFALSDGAGTYRFEGRLRNLGTGHASLWSPVSDVSSG